MRVHNYPLEILVDESTSIRSHDVVFGFHLTITRVCQKCFTTIHDKEYYLFDAKCYVKEHELKINTKQGHMAHNNITCVINGDTNSINGPEMSKP